MSYAKIQRGALSGLWNDADFKGLYRPAHKLLATYLSTADLKEETNGKYSCEASKVAKELDISELEVHKGFCALIGTSLVTWYEGTGTFSLKYRRTDEEYR